LRVFFNARECLLGDIVKPESATLVCVPLKTTISASVVKYEEKESCLYLLVGDSAVGVPYFRSLNNGFHCINYLTQ
jgi:hypothetical protein